MNTFFNKIYLWWKFRAKYFHKDLYRGIKNLITWLPVVWKDRDWDSYYIFKILEHKLKLQSKGISRRDIHLNAKRDSEIMMTCVRLMERLREEYYRMEYTDYHESKYWFEEIKDKPGYSSWKSKIESEKFDDYFKNYPLIYKKVLNGEGVFNIEDKNEYERKQKIAMNIGIYNHERAHKLLFKLLEENIQKWWD
jgi:hypothetical protein